ncbi:MAG TPA: histidine kinase [Nocardioidaceae bacterium]|nr:histidine kinase [Nocardioidaceae bacterium]
MALSWPAVGGVHPVRRAIAGFPVRDLALSGLVLLIAVASIVAGKPYEGPLAVTLPLGVLLALAVAGRTRAPVIAAGVATAAGLLQTVLASSPGSLWALAAFLVLTYSVAAERDEGPAAVGGVLIVGGESLQEWFDHGTDYVFIVLVFGGAWLLGRGMRQWRERATYAETHQRDLARLAVAEERVRIARELHDVVAHAVSVIAVQADAAEAALGHDPSLAGQPLRAIRTSAREALTDMRQMLSVLRPADEQETSRGPARGVGDIDQLVAGMRGAGLPLEVVIDSEALDLAPAVDLAVYRIVQEALTNVMKHAGRVPTSLRISATAGQVEVRVSNRTGRPGRQPGGGHGLVGIRERVASVHGNLVAGPDRGGGFVVAATLPRDGMTPVVAAP